jgi:hypothetical protein
MFFFFQLLWVKLLVGTAGSGGGAEAEEGVHSWGLELVANLMGSSIFAEARFG